MVLTNKQRRDLHSGIYEYLLSQGPSFEDAAHALAEADPSSCGTDTSAGNHTVDEHVSDDASISSLSSHRSMYSTGGLTVASTKSSSATLNRMSITPVLERKWTAVPRLQKKILELEKIIRANSKMRMGGSSTAGAGGNGKGMVFNAADSNMERKMIPRPPCQFGLKGHTGVIACVAIHPTSPVAISGSEDGMIKAWDHENGDYIRTFKGHTNTVYSVDFSPSGSHFCSTSSDLTIKLWDFSTYNCIRTLRGHEHTISSAKFIPLPPTLLPAISENNQNGNNNSNSNSNSNNTGIDTTQAGSSMIVSASRDKTVKFWDLETGYCQHTINENHDWVRCVSVRGAGAGTASSSSSSSKGSSSLSNNSCTIATAGNENSIFVYSIEQSSSEGGGGGGNGEFGSQQCVKIAALSGHDHVIESVSFVIGLATTSSSKSQEKHHDKIKDFLASGSRDRTVKLWNIKTQSCIATFAHHKNWVRSVILHPSGNYILSASDDRTIRVMDIHSQRCIRTITDAHPHFVTCIAMHHSYPIMVSGGVDQMVRCWQLD